LARQERQTEPQDTKHGLIIRYEDLEKYLVEAELRGRLYCLEQANLGNALVIPDDYTIYNLHHLMFKDIYEWAGQPRKIERGPGGVVYVPWTQVRQAMRDFALNLKARVESLLSQDYTLGQMAELIAWAHHQFQYIHPFQDTNGRTGRVFDFYLLWVTFDLAGEDLTSTPILEPFPTAQHEDDYYEGLQTADAGYYEKLSSYYLETIATAIEARDERLRN
jgi:fido (protein-threonine AMPylation protein)